MRGEVEDREKWFTAPLSDGRSFTLVCYCSGGLTAPPGDHDPACYAYTTEASGDVTVHRH